MGPAALLLKEDCAHIDQVAWNMTPRNAVATVSTVLDFQLVLMPPSGQKKNRTNAALNSISVIINNDSFLGLLTIIK